jgi:hypothetical protein
LIVDLFHEAAGKSSLFAAVCSIPTSTDETNPPCLTAHEELTCTWAFREWICDEFKDIEV